MADCGSVINRVQSYLECSICLERYENPKPLWCTHHFCKQCLEDIMTFNEDGSIVIDCPMRCEAQTYLAVDETVNDLVASYDFLGLLEALKGKDEEVVAQVPQCAYDKKCTKAVSVCCCEILMCFSCHSNHKRASTRHHGRKTNLYFNQREKKLRVVCDKHMAPCTHMCLSHRNRETFLCKYCLHRDKKHEKHEVRTVEDNVATVKAELSCYSKEVDIVFPFLRTTAENIRDIRTKVHELLDQRYEHCLSQYADFLKRKKESVRGKLKGVLEAHMAQYRAIPKYYEEKIAKDDIVLAIQRGSIIDTILALNKLACETLTVEGGDDFRSDNPLGTLSVATESEVLISNPPIPTLKLNITKPKEIKENRSPVPGCSREDQACSSSSSSSVISGRLKRTAPLDTCDSAALKRAKEFISNVVVRVDDNSDVSDVSDVDNTEDDDDGDDVGMQVVHYDTVDSDVDLPDSDSESPSESSASETV